MPEPELFAQTCPLCLNADESPDMIAVQIPHYRLGLAPQVALCRRCASAIAGAWFIFQVEECGYAKALADLQAVSIIPAAATDESEKEEPAATADDGDGQD